MTRRLVVTFSAAAAILLWWSQQFAVTGVHDTVHLILYGAEGVVGLVISLAVWVGVLVRTARERRWAWFAGVLVFLPVAPLATLVYGLAAPDSAFAS